ncbi:MAG TPA: CpaF family protein [Verrucomicrobiae bacterium]|nr:CpaF family protein [Verrucomicrobiae bacterium]
MANTPEISTQLYLESKNAILAYLIQNIDQKLLEKGDEALLRRRVEELVEEKLRSEKLPFSRQMRNRLVSDMADEILGFGPIEPLLRDPTVTEVMVNRPDQVYCERFGKLELTDIQFRDLQHIRHVIDKIVTPLGRRVDESSPMVDARLPDGSRVNAIISPLSLNGPVLTIRKFSVDPYTVEDLIGFGTLTQGMAAFLAACVKVKLNVLVSGGSGAGKTTLLNVLSSFIPEGERVVTVEDAAELKLHQPHVVRLESRPPNIEGKGEIKIRDLVRNCLRMRPDRIVVGEVRGGEALDMLQAMNTGHEGSISTVHSNTPRDALARLETMVMMSGMELPSRAIREQIAAAVHMIVQIGRLSDGSRKVISVTEIQGMEGNVIVLQDLFTFQQKGVGEGGKVLGTMQATGMVPKFIDRFNSASIHLPSEIFKRTSEVR